MLNASDVDTELLLMPAEFGSAGHRRTLSADSSSSAATSTSTVLVYDDGHNRRGRRRRSAPSGLSIVSMVPDRTP